ncbi:MAG: hypothetical protein AAFQ82_08205 [Myxococcota bacterium]
MRSYRFHAQSPDPAPGSTPSIGSQDEIDRLDRSLATGIEEPELNRWRDAALATWDQAPEVLLGHGVYPTLPLSVARVLHRLEVTQAKKVAIVDDLDGLVTLWSGESSSPESAELVVLSIPGSPGWLERLNEILERAPLVLARVRAPFDAWWQEQCRTAEVLSFRHDCDHHLTPGPFVLDGGGDHWLVKGLRKVESDRMPRHGYRDFHGLKAGCGRDELARLCQLAESRLGLTRALHEVVAGEGSLTAIQSFQDGRGFNVELRPEDDHLLLTFVPYDAALETTVVSSVYEVFGTPHTRTRPLRTVWTPTEMIF